MDSYFRNHPWIVPGSKVDKIDGRRREQELAESEYSAVSCCKLG